MTTHDLPAPECVVAFGAHPDDVEINAGGTLAKWRAHGTDLHIVVCTDGSKGTWNPDADPTALADERVAELRAALDALGGGTAHWLGAIDGELADSQILRERAAAVIRAVRPTVVIGHDPWKRYRLHPDHEQAGRIAIGAIVAARDPHFFPHHEHEPWRPSTLLLFEAEEVDHTESVDGHLDAKANALLAHRSQWQSTFGIDLAAPDLDAFRRTFASAPTEAFHRVDEL
ncbi:MAG: PIG-L deacetylase family protein [Acidimicrobiia bacterium]